MTAAKKKATLHQLEEVVERLLEEADDPTERNPEYRNYLGGLHAARDGAEKARNALGEVDKIEEREADVRSHREKQAARGDHESSGDDTSREGSQRAKREDAEQDTSPKGRVDQALSEGANPGGFVGENEAEYKSREES